MPKYHVDRSIEIDASPDDAFQYVSDFTTWPKWSPWLCAEPDAEVVISEDSKSVGSKYSWSGEIVGVGEIEHLRLDPGHLIENEIRFTKPWKAVSAVKFEFEPTTSGTKVTWHLDGSMPFFLFFLVEMTKTMLGMDYERGLKMLKERIETGNVESLVNIRGYESVGPLKMMGVRSSCSIDEIGPKMEAAIKAAYEKLSQANLFEDTEGITVYHHLDMKAKRFDFTSGFLVDAAAETPDGLSSWSIPQISALAVEHTGRYEHLGNAWSAGHRVVFGKRLKQLKVGTFEIYKNDPSKTPPEELRVESSFR
ncbi:MAG: transcriptional regulator [Planctomycetaceae bacterium]|nr:transcriptional regulator [Planctomycetaceae bacterium]